MHSRICHDVFKFFRFIDPRILVALAHTVKLPTAEAPYADYMIRSLWQIHNNSSKFKQTESNGSDSLNWQLWGRAAGFVFQNLSSCQQSFVKSVQIVSLLQFLSPNYNKISRLADNEGTIHRKFCGVGGFKTCIGYTSLLTLSPLPSVKSVRVLMTTSHKKEQESLLEWVYASRCLAPARWGGVYISSFHNHNHNNEH